MYDKPVCLQDSVIDFICENIEALCQEETVESCVETELPTAMECHDDIDQQALIEEKEKQEIKLVFKDPDACFHTNISEQILSTLCEKGKLNDRTMTLFDPSVTNLRKVSIKDAPVSKKGLNILKLHRVTELNAAGVQNVSVRDLVNCLGDWSINKLRLLNLCNGTFFNISEMCITCYCSLSRLKNLQTLNVSYTEFSQHGLVVIVDSLRCLENLDISCTQITDISPLVKIKSNLKSLSMYNLRISPDEDVIATLQQLEELRHLDISDDISVQPFMNIQASKLKIHDLLLDPECLPKLSSLDISGKEGITPTLISEFVHHHPDVSFLGLAMTDACEAPMFTKEESLEYRADIVVTGDAVEKQLLESLRRYPLRAVYVQKTLYSLFTMTQEYKNPRLDLIQLILPSMRNHPKQLGVQMAATACLYYLTKSELALLIHSKLLAKLVSLTLDSMENFPKHQQLQKNTLLTLCSDRILQNVEFDKFRCARLVMECLCSFDEPSMNRMCVAICSILAAKIPTIQTSQLGSQPEYMRKLLQMVRDKAKTKDVDATMRFTLSALWNLTDESPMTCLQFLSAGGLKLFTEVLEEYNDTKDDIRVQVETKVLGLLNNIAEVPALRDRVMNPNFVIAVRKLLASNHIEVSYFAAGIIAHLVSDSASALKLPFPMREELVQELYAAVMAWKQPDGEMVAYRSFTPFFTLLQCTEIPAVQLWAVWAIHHVCTRNGARYCGMLIEERGEKLLRDLMHTPGTEQNVIRLAKETLSTLNKTTCN